MNCRDIKKNLPGLIDNSLSENEMEDIRQHLKECENCQKEFESINKLLNSAKKIQIPEYDQSFWNARYEIVLKQAQERHRRHIFVKRLRIGFGFLGIFLILFVSKGYFEKNKPVDFIQAPGILSSIPDDVLSEKIFPLPVDEMGKIFDFLKPEDQMTILAEYLH